MARVLAGVCAASAVLLMLAAVRVVEGAELPRRGLTRATAGDQQCRNLPAGSNAAFTELMSQGLGSRCADFIHGVKSFKLEAVLRQVCRGRVIVCPSNGAMQEMFMFMGLYKYPEKIPASAKRAFRSYVMKGVCHRRSKVSVKHGCGNLYVAHKPNGLATGRIAMITNGRGAKTADAPEYEYSILGQGYNAYIGFPLAFGMSSLDPGFTLVPVFDLRAEDVKTLASTGGSCTSTFSTTQYNSISDMKTAASGGVSISAKSATWSFSGSVSVDYLSSSSTSSQTITTTSTAKIYLGGYGIVGGPASLKISPSFQGNLVPLMQAASEGKYDETALASLVDNFGTHYIKSVWWGGLASSIQQMTAQSKANVDSIGVRGDFAVKLGMMTTIDISGNISFSQSSQDKENSLSETFSMVLIPSSVKVPVTQPKYSDVSGAPVPQYIDCVAWTEVLMAAAKPVEEGGLGFRAPVWYQLAPIQSVLGMPSLFPSDWAPVLPAMAEKVDYYINNCGYVAKNWTVWMEKRACDPPKGQSECVIGTYRTKNGGCNTCYGDGSVIGPNCNATTTVSCNAYACYCMPKYALDPVANKTCTPLSPNPPAPPAPSMADLADKRRRLL